MRGTRRHRRWHTVLAAVGLVVVAVTPTATASVQHDSSSGQRPASVCRGNQAIAVKHLQVPVSVQRCPIVGRLVVTPTGIGLRVPTKGLTVGVSGHRIDGAATLTVSNLNGKVKANFSSSDAGPQRATPESSIAQNPACSQAAYHDNGGVQNGTLKWWYNSSTADRANLPRAGTLAAIREGNRNITLFQNDCGLSHEYDTAAGAYQGNTSRYANINSAAQCTEKFPDRYNTVSWGPFNSNHPTLIGLTCWAIGWYDNIVEADIYLASNRGLVLGVPPGCSGNVDVEGLVTHEWGHAYGLGHVSEAANGALTMSPVLPSCSIAARTLGLGDHRGMVAKYGL